jgi:transcriptional regulator with XRE-family HTH domain
MWSDVGVKTITPEGKIFGETLKRLREAADVSQEKLANHPRLGDSTMSTNYLSDIERGLKVPSLTTVLKLAHALGCAPADMLTEFTPAALKRLFR